MALRYLDVDIDQPSFVNNPLGSMLAPINGPQTVDDLLLFFAVWTQMNLPIGIGFDVSDLPQWMRYPQAAFVRPTTPVGRGPGAPVFALEFDAATEGFSVPQKAVHSADVAHAFMTYYLIQQVGLRSIAQTSLIIPGLPRRGVTAAPSHFGIDGNGRYVLLDCRGTQSSLTYAKSQLQKAASVKRNPGAPTPGSILGRLAAAMYTPQSYWVAGTAPWANPAGGKGTATLLICDPDWEEFEGGLLELGEDWGSEFFARLELARALRLLGARKVAVELVHHVDAPERLSKEARDELTACFQRGGQVRHTPPYLGPGLQSAGDILDCEVSFPMESIERLLGGADYLPSAFREFGEQLRSQAWAIPQAHVGDESGRAVTAGALTAPRSLEVQSPLGLTIRARLAGAVS